MSNIPVEKKIYVAPIESPTPRRPPVREIGLIGWLRHNLFSGPVDTAITLVSTVVFGYLTYEILRWALTQAQWELAFQTLPKTMMGPQFPRAEIWRVELAAFILVFLTMLSVGIWGRVTRGIQIAVAIIAIATFAVPILSERVPEPTIYTYIDPAFKVRQVNFTADAGDQITFAIEPLTAPNDFDLESITGYIENDNQATSTSFKAFTPVAQQVQGGQVDPTVHDLNLAIQILDRRGEVVAESDYSEGGAVSLTWTAEKDGWYTFTAVRNEENPGEKGYAWLRADDLEVLWNNGPVETARIEKYGTPPELDCQGCAVTLNRNDMRFEGERTIGQWFSSQLTPFLLATRQFFFIALIVGAAGYGAGKGAKIYNPVFAYNFPQLERGLSIIGTVFLITYFGIQVAQLVDPQEALESLELVVLIGIVLTPLLYAIIQLLKHESHDVERGIFIAWIAAVFVIFRLISGFEDSTVMPHIPSEQIGGLTLTLMLSAVAIIASFPVGIGLALGRQSELPVIRILCTIFIEVVRGVPLITLIFMGRYIVPYFTSALQDSDLLLRMYVVLTLFTSAYLAEVVRGGLQVVPKGQIEAAKAVGLGDFWITVLIILPQALRAVIPAIMGQAVSLFKDTSLVVIIGLYELTGSMNEVLRDSQTGYLLFPREGYLFIGIIYFIISYLMAEVSRRLERTGAGAIKRDKI